MSDERIGSMSDEPVRITRIFQPIEIELPGFSEPWRGFVQSVRVGSEDQGAIIDLTSLAQFAAMYSDVTEAARRIREVWPDWEADERLRPE